jgi:hypothetical protein
MFGSHSAKFMGSSTYANTLSAGAWITMLFFQDA